MNATNKPQESASIRFLTGPLAGNIFQVNKPIITFGRDPGNDVVISDPTVSRKHAQLVNNAGQWSIEKLAEQNVVTVNQQNVQAAVISDRDTIGLGTGTTFLFLMSSPQFLAEQRPVTPYNVVQRPSAQTPPGPTNSGQQPQVQYSFPEAPSPLPTSNAQRAPMDAYEPGTIVSGQTTPGIPMLEVSSNTHAEKHAFPLTQQVINIGRDPSNDIVINELQVSGLHARLEQVHGGYCIIDVGSTNHVYVNAQRVTNQLLQPGDEIRIGPYKFTYTGTQLTQQDESHGIRIDALQLQKVGSKHTILINDISVAIPPRTFVALVGGSGAGKSMLMDALNGLRPAQKGLVLYNGQDYYRHLAAFSTQLGYVPQDDIIHRELTVERALYYTARMRLPEDFTQAQIKQRIDEVLEDVDMKHRRGLLINKLSGGQRK